MASLQTLVVLDLDRTSLQTDLLHQDLRAATDPYIDAAAQTELGNQAANTELFDAFAGLAKHGLEYDGAAKLVRNYIRSTRGSGFSYLYGDVVPFIQTVRRQASLHLVILTQGSTPNQRFKLENETALTGVPYEITEEDKGDVLEHCFQADGTLIYRRQRYNGLIFLEDKGKTLLRIAPRPTFRGFHVIRPDAKYWQLTHRPDITVVTGIAPVTRQLLPKAA